MTVNNFRKASSSEEVISLAKSLIKNWKKLLPGKIWWSLKKSWNGSFNDNLLKCYLSSTRFVSVLLCIFRYFFLCNFHLFSFLLPLNVHHFIDAKYLWIIENSSQSSSSSQLSRSSSTASSSPKEEDQSQPETSESKEKSPQTEQPKQTSFPPEVEDTSDGVRLKCRGMLATALKTERKLARESRKDFAEILLQSNHINVTTSGS